MLLNYFLLVTIFMHVASSSTKKPAPTTIKTLPGKTCPYYGKKDKNAIDTLNSDDFKNKLSCFGKLFLKELPSHDFFFKLFNTSFKRSTLKRIFFLNCIYWEVNMSMACPIDLCKKLSENVEKAFENNLSSTDYFIIVANTLESSLREAGKLSDPIDKKEARREIRRFFSDVAHYLCPPDVEGAEESLFALDDGAMKYFRGLGITDKKEVSSIAKSFGDQFGKFGKPTNYGEIIIYGNFTSKDIEALEPYISRIIKRGEE